MSVVAVPMASAAKDMSVVNNAYYRILKDVTGSVEMVPMQNLAAPKVWSVPSFIQNSASSPLETGFA